jgi:8-oxo-dGTP pyrophosphatase MutT (NUDIX family)
VTFAAAVRRLEEGLREGAPGAGGQAHLAPRPRREWPEGYNPARIRQAAGLVLLVPVQDEAHVVLTVRADTLDRHKGQVSLAGGVVEPGETYEQAALREAHEEIGLPPGAARVLGALTPVDIPVSGFRLHPVVAAAGPDVRLHPSDREVARLLIVALAHLMRPDAFGRRSLVRDGRTFEVPVLTVDGSEIWGATAMVLSECLTLLGWPGPPEERDAFPFPPLKEP